MRRKKRKRKKKNRNKLNKMTQKEYDECAMKKERTLFNCSIGKRVAAAKHTNYELHAFGEMFPFLHLKCTHPINNKQFRFIYNQLNMLTNILWFVLFFFL